MDTSAGAVNPPVGADPNHYLSEGDIVEIARVKSNSIIDPLYNGVFFVEKVTTPTTFQYRLGADPLSGPDASQAGATYVCHPQTKRAVVECNNIDLYRNAPSSVPNPQGCISVPSQFTLPGFPSWVIRENLFRHTDGIPTNTTGLLGFSNAVRMTGLNGATIEFNLIDVEDPHPLQYLQPSANTRSLENTTMSGTLIQGGDFPAHGSAATRLFDELATSIDDILTLCF